MSEWADIVQAAMTAEVTPQRAEMRRAGDAMRAVIHRLVATTAPADVLREACEALERMADALEKYPQGRLYDGFGESANAGTPQAFFDNSPMIGQANPLAPPIRVSVVDDEVVGDVRFGAAYEGPPGCVHGGYIAAAFDEILGMAQSVTGSPGMTGRLTITYRRPTPLHADLRFVGRVVDVDGRKILTTGESLHGDDVTCEAEGLFISVDLAKMAELYEKRLSERA
jgi:acyl-coenzyme A thioesterase PaaI-like protein